MRNLPSKRFATITATVTVTAPPANNIRAMELETTSKKKGEMAHIFSHILVIIKPGYYAKCNSFASKKRNLLYLMVPFL